ncbi:MAG: TIGR03086 family protein [Actinobacteria bacterium]|nr:TIGR03086 family protein [Actinomycetota bacterium]
MSTAPLEQAIASTKAVLAGVKAEQLGASTPCASWKVSDLVNHIVGGQFFFTTVAKGEEMSSAEAPDFSAGDFNGTFDKAAADCVAAFSAEGAMQMTMHLPWGDMPGHAFAGLAATDTFMHGWDLARATGQKTDLNPELATALLAGSRMGISDAFRGPEGAPFGPEQTAPAGASAADQLAAFLGRVL